VNLSGLRRSLAVVLTGAFIVAPLGSLDIVAAQGNSRSQSSRNDDGRDNRGGGNDNRGGSNDYDRDGRDRNGFDRDGRDRDGRDRDGWDRNGRDRDGYDRDGYDRDGYDRDGCDRNGYDRRGRFHGRGGNGGHGGGHDKITICHVTGSGSVTIKISENALRAHLAHGDTIGACHVSPRR